MSWSGGVFAGLLLISMLLLGRRIRSAGAALIIAAFSVSGLGVELRALSHLNSEVAKVLEQRSFDAELIVTSDPRRIRQRVIGQDLRAAQSMIRVRVERVRLHGRSMRVRFPAIALLDRPSLGVIPGDCLRVTAHGDRLADDLPLLRITSEPESCGAAGWVQQAAAAVRAGLREGSVALPTDARGLLPGLVVGDTSELPPSLEQDMREVNLAHLTAVSGANLAIVAGFILLVARGIGLRREVLSMVVALALTFFVVLARPDPSVLRAAVMAMVLLAARMLGSAHAALSALAFAVIVLILANPDQARSPGFLLSVSATAGLILWVRPLTDRFSRRLPQWVSMALAVPVAAQLACTPFLVAISGQFSLLGVVANFAAAPLVAPATVLGLIAGMVALLWPAAAEVIGFLAGLPVMGIAIIARLGARVPFASIPAPRGSLGAALVVLLTAIGAIGLQRNARRTITIATAICVAIAGLALVRPGWPMRSWLLVTCDVGQGDGLVVRVGPESAVVVDVGPDGALMRECLDRLHIERIPILFITHAHADHMEGLPEVLASHQVDLVVLPALADPPAQYRRLIAMTAGHRTRVARAGDRFEWPAARVHVLWPRTQIDEGSPANNNSTVLLVEIGRLRALLLADVEREAQSALPGIGGVDLVKIAHHGSANQAWRLFDQWRPAVGVISVGTDNPYGHPDPTLLNALSVRGIRVFRTDLAGSLAFAGSGARVEVLASGHPFWVPR